MTILAYVLVTLQSGSEKEMCKKISEFDEVVEVNELYGEYDVMLKVQVDDLSDLDGFLSKKLRSMTNVYLTSTMIVANNYK